MFMFITRLGSLKIFLFWFDSVLGSNCIVVQRNIYKAAFHIEFMKKAGRVFAFALLSLFLISMFAGVVSADAITDAVRSGWDSLTSSSSNTGFLKFLLTSLIVMIVYSVVSFLPFVPEGKDYINWIIAAIVGILSFMYVDALYIQTIVSNYEALGIALTSILPLVIIILFTYRLREEHPEMASLINKPLIVLFTTYLIFRWYVLFKEGSGLTIIYAIAVIVSFGWLLFEKWIYVKIAKAFLKGDVDSAKDMYESEIAAKLRRLYDLRTTASGRSLTGIDKQIAELEDKLKNMH